MISLAYRIYPEPNGQIYTKDDLSTSEQVLQLFDYCQILEAIIYKQGWEFLIYTYGYENLYNINQESGWFDCSDLKEFVDIVNTERLTALISNE